MAPVRTYTSAKDAVADIADGAVIGMGGFGVPHRWPSSLIAALGDGGARDLTIICNTLGFGPISPQILAENRQVRRLIACFGGIPYRRTAVEEQIAAGEVDFELVPQGTLAERLRAGGAGIPAFYTATGVGTQVAEGKEQRQFDGRTYLLETALRPEFALIRAEKADTQGNLVFRAGSRNLNPLFAMAARVTIAEVDEIVEAGELDPEAIVVPRIFVDRLVKSGVAMDRQQTMDLLRSLGRAPAASRSGVEDLGVSRDLMALRASRLINDGEYVNLGMGIPLLVSSYVQEGREIVLHAENGILGYGPLAEDEEVDLDLYNAGGQPVTLRSGAAFFDSSLAFAMIRGGHLDSVILGGLQVSEQGDLANWWAPQMGAGGVGGAMDVAVGARQVIVMMEHVSREGEPKIVRQCSYPLTAPKCVSLILTDLALIEVAEQGLVLREVAPGRSVEDVQRHTEPRLIPTPNLREMEFA